MEENDDWDNVPPPQSRSDRIQRITSPDSTLQRPRRVLSPPNVQPMHPGSSASLARAAQIQQMQLTAALLQQSQGVMGSRPGSVHPLDYPYDPQFLAYQSAYPPSHLSSMRRHQPGYGSTGHYQERSASLPRPNGTPAVLSIPPLSPAPSSQQHAARYRSPSSLPPSNGQQLKPAGPPSALMSPNLNARRISQKLELQLDQQGLTTATGLTRNSRNMQHVDGFMGPQQPIYNAEGSTTSSYKPTRPHPNGHSRLPHLPSQILEHGGGLEEDGSCISQKTWRTQESIFNKSAPTPASGTSTGTSAPGSTSTPTTKQTDASGTTTLSASAKYAEYISNLEKYQHPPPSKRHVTFLKYRGKQCTVGMLIAFAVLVIGLVVAPVVYFTAFANKAQSAAYSSAPSKTLTNVVNGQLTLDTTYGSYADLFSQPAAGRPSDATALKRVQRDIENLLKEVLQGPDGFSPDELNAVVVSEPQRSDVHQIFMRFQVLLKSALALDAAEGRISKALAGAQTTDNVGIRLRGVPIVANSLFFRAVPQSVNGTNAQLPTADNEPKPPVADLAEIMDNPAASSTAAASLATTSLNPVTRASTTSTTSTTRRTQATTTTASTLSTLAPTSVRPLTTKNDVGFTDSEDDFIGVGVVMKGKMTTQNIIQTSPVFTLVTSAAELDNASPSAASSMVNTAPTSIPMSTIVNQDNQAQMVTVAMRENFSENTRMPQFVKTSAIPSAQDTRFPTNTLPEKATTALWNPIEETRMPNTLVQQNGVQPNGGPMDFAQSQFQRVPNGSPAFQPTIPQMAPEQNIGFQDRRQQSLVGFQRPPDRPPPPAPNGFLAPHPFQPFGPVESFSLTQFDDPAGQASSASRSFAGQNTSSMVTAKADPESITTSATLSPKPRGTETSTLLEQTTESFGAEDTWLDETATTSAPHEAHLTESMTSTEMSSGSTDSSHGSDPGTQFSASAPVLVSEWGQWSDWGTCSAPRCSPSGFQMRTRVCLTAINGAQPVPDHDGACAGSGGQAIEARPCVCPQSDEQESSASTLEMTTHMSSEPMSSMEAVMTDQVETILPTSTAQSRETQEEEKRATTEKSKYTWGQWSDWSTCSARPCSTDGTQGRNRSCRNNLTGFSVPNSWCYQLTGKNTETRSCVCDVEVGEVISEEEQTTKRPRQLNSDRVAFQPQRGFGLQIQNRATVKRPTELVAPRTCSLSEKPCNNGQCILSHRICDGFPDCSDGSDEPLGCGRCFSGEFKCTNGRCISESLVCDGRDNCGDGTDEQFC